MRLVERRNKTRYRRNEEIKRKKEGNKEGMKKKKKEKEIRKEEKFKEFAFCW